MNVIETLKSEAIGTKVILRSNENDPLLIGEIVRFEQIRDSYFPVILVDGKEVVSMGIILPYNEMFVQYLNSMSPKEQWAFLVPFVQKFRAIDLLRRGLNS